LARVAHLTGMETTTPAQAASPSGLKPLLGIAELSEYLGVPLSTLYDWRTRGEGPVAHRFGKHLKFAVADVATWVASRREESPGERR
jgi:excisionase family DNA binding protein